MENNVEMPNACAMTPLREIDFSLTRMEFLQTVQLPCRALLIGEYQCEIYQISQVCVKQLSAVRY